MIKNVVFDLGRVIYRFWPREDIINLGYDNTKADQLMACMFDSPLWLDIDRGLFTIQEGIEKLCAASPEQAADIRKIMDAGWADRVETLMPESVAFFFDVKNRGYKIYILSNWSWDGFDYIRARDSHIFDEVDGIIVSGFEKTIKPEPEIYHRLLNRYSLIPEETLFIDDNQNNIAAAKALGIHGIVFVDIEDCKRQFEHIIGSLK